MLLKPDTPYRVTKGNTDGCVIVGDILYIDGKTGKLVVNHGGGWLEPDELTPEVMDFEAEIAEDYEIARLGRMTALRKKG